MPVTVEACSYAIALQARTSNPLRMESPGCSAKLRPGGVCAERKGLLRGGAGPEATPRDAASAHRR